MLHTVKVRVKTWLTNKHTKVKAQQNTVTPAGANSGFPPTVVTVD